MKRSLVITLLAASYAALFYAGRQSVAQPPSGAPAAVKGTAVSERPAEQAARAKSVAVAAPAAPLKADRGTERDDEFRRLKVIFGSSHIQYLDSEATLSDAASMIIQLTREERKFCDAEIDRLIDGLVAMQKSAMSVKDHSDTKQTYRIEDFSKQGEAELQKTREALERALGGERSAALLEGIEKNHRNTFFDFGRGITEVSFEERGGRFTVHEKKLSEQGDCYASTQFDAKELPRRYQRLFTVKQ